MNVSPSRPSGWVSTFASVAVATFAASYFLAALVSAWGAR